MSFPDGGYGFRSRITRKKGCSAAPFFRANGAPVLPRGYSKPSHPAKECGFVDTQFTGGLPAFEVVPGQRLRDRVPVQQLVTGSEIECRGGGSYRRAGYLLRQVFHIDAAIVAVYQAAFDHVLELPNVAGPIVGHEVREHRRRETFSGRVPSGLSAIQDLLREHGNIDRAIAQRGNLQGGHVDAIVQILSEPTGLYLIAEDSVRRGDHPNIGGLRRGGTQRFIGPLLQHPQQACLHSRRDITDLIEKDRAPFGQTEASGLVLARSGEGSLSVPEELRLQQRVGQRSAVHRHEGFVRPWTQIVNGSGKQFLPRPGFAVQQHGGVTGGRSGQHAEQAVHRYAATAHAVNSLYFSGDCPGSGGTRQRPKGIDAADYLLIGVTDNGGRDTDWKNLTVGGAEETVGSNDRLLRLESMVQGTVGTTGAELKDLATGAADGVLPGHAGQALAYAIEGGDPPTHIDGEDPVGHGIDQRVRRNCRLIMKIATDIVQNGRLFESCSGTVAKVLHACHE